MTEPMTYVRHHRPLRWKKYRAGIVRPKTSKETMPTACEGKNLWNGKRNPVMLVKTVVDKKSAVQLSRRFAVRNPATTTNPARIPIKLNRT